MLAASIPIQIARTLVSCIVRSDHYDFACDNWSWSSHVIRIDKRMHGSGSFLEDSRGPICGCCDGKDSRQRQEGMREPGGDEGGTGDRSRDSKLP